MRQSSSNQSFVVGIAGGSASGKSTFTSLLKSAMESGEPPIATQILPMDKYARHGEDGAPQIVLSPTGETMFDWNRPELFDAKRLAGDIDIAAQAANAPEVVLVEGLMVLHMPEIRRKLDLSIFVDLDADQRALRRMLRNMSPERGSQAPHFIAGYYQQSARVGHALFVEPSRAHADLIVRGDSDFHRIAPMIAAVIENERKSRAAARMVE